MTLVYAVIAALLLGFGVGWYFGGLHGKAQLEAMQASQFKALADAYQAQQLAAQTKQKALEAENETLSADALKYPDVSVRVCKLTGPPMPRPAPSGQVLSAGPGVLPQAPVADPPDIGPTLFADADRADEIVAKCRAL
jgi:hypothetical protein